MATGRATIKWILVVSLAVFLFILYKGCIQRATFDADRIAAAETAMWKAYYSGNKRALALELISLQRHQFGLTITEASQVAWDMANAAEKFIAAKENYGPIVLPDLESAYTRIKRISGLDFDPKEVAQAELDWWVARRTLGNNAPEQVGAKIAHLYALLYGEEKLGF